MESVIFYQLLCMTTSLKGFLQKDFQFFQGLFLEQKESPETTTLLANNHDPVDFMHDLSTISH